MTFLEFVLRRYVGPPAGNYWRCPWCEHPNPSLVVNAPLGKHAIKFRCHRCRAWGDEFDVMKCFGLRDYSERLKVAAELRREWEAAETATGDDTEGASPSLPRGERPSDRALRIWMEWEGLRADFAKDGIDPDEALAVLGVMFDRGHFRDEGLEWVGDVVEFERSLNSFIRERDELDRRLEAEAARRREMLARIRENQARMDRERRERRWRRR